MHMSKNNKTALVPRLRFPEFWDAGEWKICTLSELAVRITTRNRGSLIKRVLTNSAIDGVIDQNDYFDREVANPNNLENYYVIDEGDYVYNPRISATAPVGPISKNKIGKGVMSPLYTIFRFKNHNNDFYEQYFNTNLWHSYLKNVSNTGARHDRMSISNDTFMKMPLPNHSNKEQQKIADCLSSLDELIAAEDKKLETLKAHKKGLMQKLFSREIRLKDKGGRDYPEWSKKQLSDICFSISSGKSKKNANDNGFPLYGSTGMIGKTDVVDYDGEYLLVARVGANAGHIYTIYGKCGISDNTLVIDVNRKKVELNYLNYFLGNYNLNKFIFGSGQPLVTGSQLKAISLELPSLPEQKRIADCFSSVDELIAAQGDKIESLKTHKKGLMQSLFPSIEGVIE